MEGAPHQCGASTKGRAMIQRFAREPTTRRSPEPKAFTLRVTSLASSDTARYLGRPHRPNAGRVL